MMRLLMAAALGAAVSLTVLASPVSAATDSEDQVLILKKKKKAAAARAAAEKKQIEEAKAKADALRKLKAQKAALKRKEAASNRQSARKRDCDGFLECLFGKRKPRVTRNGSFQTASFSGSAGLSNRKTRKIVDWNESKYPAGSLVVRTPERALYYVLGDGEAVRYSVGVGREGMQWSGSSKIVSKQEWPSWTPPQVMIEREAAKGNIIPSFMEGGPGNPLGARALYIGGTIFRVHGTNNEASIGGAVSSGCIRMMNADVIDLYDRVKIGSKIYVYQ